MQTNKWLMGLGVAASLAGCGDLGLWSKGGDGPRGSAGAIDGPSGTGGGGAGPAGFSERPIRLPTSPISAETTLPAISGGTLTISPSGTYAVASDPDRDVVYVVQLAERSVSTVQLERGAEPGRVAFDSAGAAHVILRGTGSVARVDPGLPEAFTSAEVCDLPRGIAYVQADDSLAVACASGDVVRLAAADHTVRSRNFIDTDLRDVIVNGAGKVLVSRFRTAELLEIKSDGALARRSRPKQRASFRFGPSGEQSVTMLPGTGWRALPTGDGKVIMLHQEAQREVVQVSEGGYGGFGDCSAISHPTVSVMGEGTISKQRTFGLAGVALAVDAAVSPDQRWLAVAAPSAYLRGGDTVMLYSAVSAEPPIENFSDAGVPPTPGVDAAICSFSIATAGFDSQITAVAFAPDGRLITQSREPARIQTYQVAVQQLDHEGAQPWATLTLVNTIELGGASVRDSGHDLFHADVGGGIACASCHAEATDDGHVWNFDGIGPRRTQNMRGGLKGTAPFHWDGDMVTFDHLVDNVLTGRMSGFPVEKPFADALISWIDAQPALRLPVRDAAAAERGKKLFESATQACTSCHSGKNLTNNGTFDVGTGGTFQVPSLHGLGLRAPFMHDGCAKTLRQRFDKACGGGDQHGKTSTMTPAQIDDLTSYLQSL